MNFIPRAIFRTLMSVWATSQLLIECPPLKADTVLETETAELGKKGEWLVSCSIQFEKDPDGKGAFTLFQYEYALTDRAEILIEPFFYEWQRPKDGPNVGGLGDLEITPSYIAILETEKTPAVAVALKVKVPTATDHDIGTGKVDYYPYLIFGKHLGPDWIFNANIGVDFIGNVSGENLKNQLIYDLSAERKLSEEWSVFAEIFGNSKTAPGERSTFAGAVAAEYQINGHFNTFVSVGYDTDHVFNIRPGFNIHF